MANSGVVRVSYPRIALKEIVWKLRDAEDVPSLFRRGKISNATDLVNGFYWLFDGSPTEKVYAFILNAQNVVATIDLISSGTVNCSLLHPREVFRAAVLGFGCAVIVAHNHPSGSPEPSAEDIAITRQLSDSGKVLGIPLHDHIVFGAYRSYVSLAERGAI